MLLWPDIRSFSSVSGQQKQDETCRDDDPSDVKQKPQVEALSPCLKDLEARTRLNPPLLKSQSSASGVLVNQPLGRRACLGGWGRKSLDGHVVTFLAVNPPTVASVRLPMRQHWMQSWEEMHSPNCTSKLELEQISTAAASVPRQDKGLRSLGLQVWPKSLRRD